MPFISFAVRLFTQYPSPLEWFNTLTEVSLRSPTEVSSKLRRGGMIALWICSKTNTITICICRMWPHELWALSWPASDSSTSPSRHLPPSGIGPLSITCCPTMTNQSNILPSGASPLYSISGTIRLERPWRHIWMERTWTGSLDLKNTKPTFYRKLHQSVSALTCTHRRKCLQVVYLCCVTVF